MQQHTPNLGLDQVGSAFEVHQDGLVECEVLG